MSEPRMIKCPKCGSENRATLFHCEKCGTNLHLKPCSSLDTFEQPISEQVKWRLYYAAWVAVVLATLVMDPAYLLSAPGFPIGLLALLPNGEDKAIIAGMLAPISFGIGWGFYILLSLLIGRTRKKTTFTLVYIAFCIILALNLVGCEKTFDAAAGLH